MDRWFRFEPSIQARWEVDLGEERVADLRHAIIVGLVLYNAFNFSDPILMPDTAWRSVLARVALATPATLLLYYAVARVPPRWRERLVAMAIVNAAFLPIPAFIQSDAPLALFAFSQFFLSVVFANMLVALRFRHACAVTAVCFVVGTATLPAKELTDGWLATALIIQYVTVCVFSLYANYLSERRRSERYLSEFAATLRSEFEERARQRFQDLSFTDTLTGLPNRRLLNERLEKWSAERTATTIVMVDIDHFKLFNDALGHPAGDDCLRRVAQVLHAIADDRILAARFGGEEFMIAMRDMPPLNAAQVARGRLAALETLRIPHPGRTDGVQVVTASAGAASREADEEWSPLELIRDADNALYVAKREGRNRFSMVASV